MKKRTSTEDRYTKKARELFAAAQRDESPEETIVSWLASWRGYVDDMQRIWKANERRHSITGFKNRTLAVLDTIRRAPISRANRES